MKRLIPLGAAVAALALLAPLAGGIPIPVIDEQCAPNTGDAAVEAPTAAITVNWKPACVEIGNGRTVTWTNNDSTNAPHGFEVIQNCVDFGTVGNGGTQNARFTYDAATKTLTIAGTKNRTCGLSGVIQEVGNDLVIKYECSLHGSAAMPGKIVVNL